MTFQEYLIYHKACHPAQLWARDKTSTEAWKECSYPGWLLWWADRELPWRDVVHAAGEALRSIYPPGYNPPKEVLQWEGCWGDEGDRIDLRPHVGGPPLEDSIILMTDDVLCWIEDLACDLSPSVDYREERDFLFRQACGVIRRILPQPWREDEDKKEKIGDPLS